MSTPTEIELKPISESIEVQIKRNSTIGKQEMPNMKFPDNTQGEVPSIVVQKRESSIIGEDPLYQDHDPVRIAQIIKDAQNTQPEPEPLGADVEEGKPAPKPYKWYAFWYSPMGIIGIIGVIIAIAMLFIPLDPINVKVQRCAAILILMAIFWLTEMLPLAITALFPVVFFPYLQVLSANAVSGTYFNNTIFMFFSGFLMSLAMERWNLHIRISCFVCQLFKTPRSLLFGIMFVSWFLSMWISNTASALMMVANANALVMNLENNYGTEKMARFSKGIMIGIAFACNAGGLGTLIGTPPNLIFQQMFTARFPPETGAPEINFSNWLFSQLPGCIILFLCIWLFLALAYAPSSKVIKIDSHQAKADFKALGKATYEEWIVGVWFIILAILWLFRADISLGEVTIPGWTSLLKLGSYVSDGTVGMTVALLLFIWPTYDVFTKKDLAPTDQKFILTWETAKKLPWDLVLLFGGGFALAEACTSSGFSAYLGNLLSGLANIPIFLCIFLITLIVSILTSFTSNTATATIIIPVMISISLQIHRNPLLFLFPATIACSCAYLMPVGTPPNLIVFTSGKITIADMVKSGIVVTLIAVFVTMFSTFVMVPAIYGFDINEFPDWANTTTSF